MEDYLYYGTIVLVPYTYSPKNTVMCNGQLLSCQEFVTLYAVLGNTFGGRHDDDFGVPNLRGFEPHPNTHYVMIIDGCWPERPSKSQ